MSSQGHVPDVGVSSTVLPTTFVSDARQFAVITKEEYGRSPVIGTERIPQCGRADVKESWDFSHTGNFL